MTNTRLSFLVSALVASAALLAGPAAADTLAERLGKDREARLLILHADDLGMCQAASAAARTIFGGGLAVSGSAMVPCPWFADLATWAAEQKDAPPDLGLHLALTSEWKTYRWGPVLPRSEVPGLVDPDGFLWRSVEELARHASADEVEREIRAQVERARHFGLSPTHLDSHMGALFARLDYFAAYVSVATEAGVVPFVPRLAGELREKIEKAGLLPVAEAALADLESKGYPLVDRVENSGGKTYEERKARLLDVVAKLEPGVTEIILHPAADGPELQAITHSHRARGDDLALLCDPDLRAAIERAGVVLVTWREIGAAWKKEK
ncbi:MAG: polysaccharide deacetylase family protein [Planctomycetes bacterium]|nr:polysaccharide deacetylase family protein [Planctomycetota bacterium]